MANVYAIVVTFNPDLLLLKKCVDSIYSQVQKIFIIDNNSKNKKKILNLFKTYNHLEIIFLNKNMGIGYAQNIGLRKAISENSDYILLSDQDSIFPKNFLKKMIEAFNDPKIVAAGPLFIDTNLNETQFFVLGTRWGFKKIFPTKGKYKIFQLISSGTLIKTSLLKKVGLMREDFFIDWIDIEWCWRAINKGYIIIGNADVKIHHQLGTQHKNFFNINIKIRDYKRHYYIIRNGIYLSLYSPFLNFPQKITLFFRYCTYMALYTFFGKPHLKNFVFTLKGFYHGITGKLGKINEK